MTRYARAIAFVSCLLGVATAIACADDDPAGPPGEADASSDAARIPDAGGAEDASADARPDVSYDAASEPVACAVTPCAVALAAGEAHVCAVLDDGTVRCWGDDTKGALGFGGGDGGANDAGVGPVQVAGLTGVTQIAAAGRSTCARSSGGGVKCWGANHRGQLGASSVTPTFDEDDHSTPSPVALNGPASRVDVGHDSACAHLESGELQCWGANQKSQLLRPEPDADAVEVGGPAGTEIASQAGLRFSRTTFGSVSGFGITSAGRLASWGVVSGRVASIDVDPVPRELATLSEVIDVAASAGSIDFRGTHFHTCVIAAGSVYCWGKSIPYEQVPALCNGVPNPQRTPVPAPVSGKGYPQQIAVAQSTTCVRLTDGTVECCGDDSRGQMGRGAASKDAVLAFTRASALDGYAVRVVTGDTMTCALLREGRVVCWGGNQHGELGQRSVDSAAHPVPVSVSF